MLTKIEKAGRRLKPNLRVHPGASSGLLGLSAPARQPWGKNCGVGCVPPVIRHLPRWRRTPCRDRRDLGHSAENRRCRRCAMRGCVGCWLGRVPMSSARHLAVSPRCSVGTARTSLVYREIYLRVPIDELRRRDSKGIYAGLRRRCARRVGLDVPRRLPKRRTWSSTIMDARRCYGGRPDIGGMHRRDGAGVTQPARLVAFKTKANLWARWRRCCAMGAFCRKCDSRGDWRSDAAGVLRRRHRCALGSGRVIVRSSARSEDGAASSQAGRYDSGTRVVGSAAVAQAIDRVIDSFAKDGSDDDQIFVQPMLDRVAMAGVVFSRSPSGAPISLSITTTVPA